MTLLFKDATIVCRDVTGRADVLVEGGLITAVASGTSVPAGAEIIDASGKYLLPGGIDVHTHFDLDIGQCRTTDDFHSGTVAAACGGVTTIVDHMGFGPPDCRLRHQFDVYRGLAKDAVVDYSLHGVFQHVDDQVLADMATLAEEGVTSLKVYMTYAGKLEDRDVLRVLERARELGLVICAHCENDAIIAHRTRRLLAEGKTAPRFHPVSRPDYCEAESVYRLLSLARAAGDAPLYIVHLSTALGLEAVRDARARGQRNIFVETCPHYLFFDDSRYDDDAEGLKYFMAPPLRRPEDSKALWDGLKKGDIDVVATDHCPFNFAVEKQAGVGDFSHCPGGVPGVEARMPLLFSEGFMKGRLTLPEVVNVCCLRPAEIFGLRPEKGVVEPGADADLVLFDPEAEWVMSHSEQHERVDYTPYEGMALRGKPVLTVSRGEIVVRDGEFSGKAGRGRFLKRKIP